MLKLINCLGLMTVIYKLEIYENLKYSLYLIVHCFLFGF